MSKLLHVIILEFWFVRKSVISIEFFSVVSNNALSVFCCNIL